MTFGTAYRGTAHRTTKLTCPQGTTEPSSAKKKNTAALTGTCVQQTTPIVGSGNTISDLYNSDRDMFQPLTFGEGGEGGSFVEFDPFDSSVPSEITFKIGSDTPMGAETGWAKIWSAPDNQNFYHHAKSVSSQWEKPEGFSKAKPGCTDQQCFQFSGLNDKVKEKVACMKSPGCYIKATKMPNKKTNGDDCWLLNALSDDCADRFACLCDENWSRE